VDDHQDRHYGALVPFELLQVLDELYPERCPTESMSERAIWIAAGKRQLINWLHAQYMEQFQRTEEP
jgi:hypothetical protein